MTLVKNSMVLPRAVFLDVTGSILVNGQVQTYQAGTTTPATTYQDAGGVSPNSNPIILDAFGSATIWLDPTQVYDFAVYDSIGNLQYTISNVVGLPSTLGTAASANIGLGPNDVLSTSEGDGRYVKQGLFTISVPAAAMTPNAVNPTGAASSFGGQFDTFIAVPFLQAAVNQASFVVFMPQSYDPTQTIGVEVFWTVNGITAGNVVWQLDAAAMSSGSASPTSSGATVAFAPSPAPGVALSMVKTPKAQLPVVTNSAKGCQLNFVLSRQGTNVADTLLATALLRGVRLTYSINAADDS